MVEQSLYIFYDIEDDRVRTKVAEACRDYGLERIQFSGFLGVLNKNKREELFLKFGRLLDGKTGKVLMLPVCERDIDARREIIRVPPDD